MLRLLLFLLEFNDQFLAATNYKRNRGIDLQGRIPPQPSPAFQAGEPQTPLEQQLPQAHKIWESLYALKNRIEGSRYLDIGIAIGLAIAIFLWMWLMRFTRIILFDEGILLTYSEQILKGYVPNRDFFSIYPPGNLWILAAMYKVFGVSFMTERALGMIYRLLLVMAIFVFALPRGRIVAACGALMSAWATTFSGLAAFNWMGAIAIGLWSLLLLAVAVRQERFGNVLVASSGLLAGFIGNIRADMPALAILLAAAPLLLRVSRKRQLYFAVGWLMGFAPFIIHFVHAGAHNVIDNLFIQPIFRIGPGRRLSIFPEDSSAAALMFVTMGGVALIVLATAIRIVWHRRPQDWVYLSLAIFTLCISPQALQRADTDHFMYVGQVAWGLAPMAFSFLLDPFRTDGRSNVVLQVVVISLLVNVMMFARLMFPPQLPTDLHAFTLAPNNNFALITHQGRSIPMTAASDARFIESMLNFVDSITKPGDRIFVGPGDLRYASLNDVYIYHLLPQLRPASYYMEVNPNSSNAADSPLPKDLETADVLLLNDTYNGSTEKNAAAMPGSDAAEKILQTRFTRRASGGPFEIYQRNPSP